MLMNEAETSSCTAKEKKRIDMAKMKVLRTMVGKTRKNRVRTEWVSEKDGSGVDAE